MAQGSRSAFVDLTHEVPREFIASARKLKLKPERLAKILCEDFARHAPKCLTIISTLPAIARNAGDVFDQML